MSADPASAVASPASLTAVRPARLGTSPLAAYVRLEVRRMLRNPRSILFTVLVPIMMFVLFSGLADTAHDKRMVLAGMVAYAAIGASLFATGPRLSAERATGWLRQLRATPLSPWAAVTGKVAAGLLLALISSLLVGAVGLVTGAGIGVTHWLELAVAMTLAASVTAALGLLFGGAIRQPDTAQGATLLSYLALSAVGGLWVPPDQFPHWLQQIAHVLPTYHVGTVSRAIADGGAVGAGHCAIILAWTAVLTVAAVAAWRRGTRVR